MVVFEEIPDEISLAINITNCPCHCKGCHSHFLWEDSGTALNEQILQDLIERDNGITCVLFMGGDAEPSEISKLASFVKETFPNLKVGWYSGQDDISSSIRIENFDFIKIGRYQESLGGLNSPTTNQKLYQIISEKGKIEKKDITFKFLKRL